MEAFEASPLAYIIIGATVFISWKAFEDFSLKSKLVFSPYDVKHLRQWYKILTHGFIHADYMHLGINMFVLYSFSTWVEAAFVQNHGLLTGELMFLILYVGAIAFATIPSMRKHADNPSYAALGASGAVSAILMAFIIMFPLAELRFFFLIPMPGFIAGLVFFGLESYLNKRGRTGVAHDAHIWGAIFGILFVALADINYFVHFFQSVNAYVSNIF